MSNTGFAQLDFASDSRGCVAYLEILRPFCHSRTRRAFCNQYKRLNRHFQIDDQVSRYVMCLYTYLKAKGALSTRKRCAAPKGVAWHHESCPKRNIEMIAIQLALYPAISHRITIKKYYETRRARLGVPSTTTNATARSFQFVLTLVSDLSFAQVTDGTSTAVAQ